MKYVEVSEFRELAKNKKPRNVGVKFTSVAAPEVMGDSRTFRFCFSDSGVDLQGDKLNAQGWDTTNFEKNPVVLFSHDATQPIGKASNLTIEGDRLLGDITFAATSLADEVCELVCGGFVRAVSVGFVPIEYKYSDDPDRTGGIDFDSMSLLEVSVCSIPCNPRALIEAQAAGISTKNLETWLVDRVNNKRTPEAERVVIKNLLNTKDMSESDPSTGGYTVGNCGRDKAENCGMINPEECAIHRSEGEDETEEKTLMAMSEALKQARELIRALNKEIAAYRVKAEEGEDEGDKEGEDPEVYLSKAEAHRKAAEELHDSAVDHMEECHKCYKAFSKMMKSMNDGDDDEDDRLDEEKDEDEDSDNDTIEKIKARAVARMSR